MPFTKELTDNIKDYIDVLYMDADYDVIGDLPRFYDRCMNLFGNISRDDAQGIFTGIEENDLPDIEEMVDNFLLIEERRIKRENKKYE